MTTLVRCLATIVLIIGPAPAVGADNAHDFVFQTAAGEEIALSEFAGQAVLIAVSDPYCGLTNQYPELQRLWERYREEGLVVIGVPTDAFIERQSVSPKEFEDYCRDLIGISFPLAQTVDLLGETAHPFFAWLRAEVGPSAFPRLPFYKYLIGPDGELVAWFPPAANPDAPPVREAVEQAVGGGKAVS